MGYKAAIITEGSAENAIINILLDNDKLIYSRKDILENTPLNIRKASNFKARFDHEIPRDGFKIYIVEDKETKFKYKRKNTEIIHILTRPEIEVLLLIRFSLFEKFNRSGKNNYKASEYLSQNLKGYKKK